MIEIKGRYFIALGVVMYILYFIFSNYYDYIIKHPIDSFVTWNLAGAIICFIYWLCKTNSNSLSDIESIVIIILIPFLGIFFIVGIFIYEFIYKYLLRKILPSIWNYLDTKLTIKLKIKN